MMIFLNIYHTLMLIPATFSTSMKYRNCFMIKNTTLQCMKEAWYIIMFREIIINTFPAKPIFEIYIYI